MATDTLTTLYRPVGINELKLIHDSGMKAFPPRLPEQPIFYPVMNREYAARIARDWNATTAPDYVGFVLSFEVPTEYLMRYPIQIVGGREHEELWVPAEELEEFNRQIAGEIVVLDVFRGRHCTLELDETTRLPLNWLNKGALWEGRYLRLMHIGKWEYVERKGVTGVVAILAITDENRLLLIEQMRPAIGKIVVEIPAGLAGDVAGSETEELASAARRELLEETGYEAREMEYLMRGPSSAGLTNEMITFFHARGLTRVSDDIGDGSEQITVHEVPLDEVDSWLAARTVLRHEIDHKIYAALYCVNRRENP